jgi:peptidoglycan/LPS O-acetylase OafA/YrhL
MHLGRPVDESRLATFAITRTEASSNRIHGLDGLRGVAAATVVLTHVLMTNLAFNRVVDQPAAHASDHDLAWWWSYTPLRIVGAGREAVLVFFVLSGYVLTQPLLSGRTFRWRGYYPKRLTRLYLPVAGAVVLALAWARIAPRVPHPEAGWWLDTHPAVTTLGPVVQDVLLLGSPGTTNGVLWSLKWEVLFSVLLPLFLIVGRRLERVPWPLSIAALALLCYIPTPAHEWGQYLPMFAIGVVLAMSRDDIALLASRITDGRHAKAAWGGLVALCLLALDAYWLLYAVFPGAPKVATQGAKPIVLLGAALAVLVVVHCPGAGRLFALQPVAWMGSRSYSLYLVHEPIVVSVALLLGGTPSVLATAVLAIPLSVVVTEVFYRSVERPSLLLARSVGKRWSGVPARTPGRE